MEIKINISAEEVKGLMACVSVTKEAIDTGAIDLSPRENERLQATPILVLYERLLDIQSLILKEEN